MTCPICLLGSSAFHARIDGYDYLQCGVCESLHIHGSVLEEMDAGKSPRLYDEVYWAEELRSSRERAMGIGLVRTGEAILYATCPVRRFLDIGTGPGYLLDELSKQFPLEPELFHGVELFPPEVHTSHPNYHLGEIGQLDQVFDGGVCIEVVEHLTPRMLTGLVSGLAKVSAHGSLWLFNTGMPDYVLSQDPNYLDPLNRGHVVSYGLRALVHIFEPYGFRVSLVPGKNYAFVAEFNPADSQIDFEHRFNHPLDENKTLLEQSMLIFLSAFESARSSYYHEEYLARTRWALTLQKELNALQAVTQHGQKSVPRLSG